MTLNVKWIASSLWPSIQKLALPFDATKCMKVTMRSADNISSYDCVQFGCCPQAALLGRYTQLNRKVGSDPLRQPGGKPLQDWLCDNTALNVIELDNACTSNYEQAAAPGKPAPARGPDLP